MRGESCPSTFSFGKPRFSLLQYGATDGGALAFYTDLSDVYDVLFPVSEAQRALFARLLAAGGGRPAAPPPLGAPGLGALARAKLFPFPRARVEAGGFSDISRIVSPPADLVLCLGNSQVHVPQDEAARFLRDAASVTSGEGEILLQILNYERLLLGNVTTLPLMSAEEWAIEFRRSYVWEGNRKVRFQTMLRISKGGEPRIVRNDIPLYPLYPDELREMLSRAGFPGIRLFGDFAGSGFTPESEALVCQAGKR